MPVENQTALVERIKSELVARGQTFQTNCDAFSITGRVAWELRQRGAVLLVKNPGQNGCDITSGPHAGRKVSHDAIGFLDGWVDCLASAGPPSNENRPVWQWTPGPPAVGLEPWDMDAGVVQPDPEPEPDQPGGGTVPMPDLIAIIQTAVDTSMQKHLEPIANEVAEIKRTQTKGLGGTVMGYRVRLKP